MPFKSVSLYGSAATPAQRDYALDPRRSLALSLLNQATSAQPVQSHTEGLSKLGQALLGGYFGNVARQEMRDRETRAATDLASGIQGAMAKPWVNPDTGQTSTAPAGNYAGLAAALGQTGNPDVAPFANQAMMAQLAAEQATKQQQAQFGQQAALAQQAAQAAKELKAAPGFVKPEPGKNVPLPSDVFAQQKELAQVKADVAAQAAANKPLNPLEQAKLKKIEEENAEKETQKTEVAASLDRTIRTGKELLAHPGRQAATGMSFLLSKVPGTDAKDFAANLEAFKSQNFLPAVQQLKGLGQLSNAEGLKLEAAVGALDPSMSEEAFEKSLKAIIGDLEAAKRRAPGSMTPNPQTSGAANVPAPPPGFQVIQ